MKALPKIAVQALLLLTICLCSTLAALEIGDIPYPLTRDQADAISDKSYSYSLLADGTIRRTWQDDKKTIVIDFNSSTGEALLIGVTYKKPVSKKDGIADAHALGKDKVADGSSWDLPKDKAAKQLITDTFGLNNARRKKLTDKAMIFYETNDKGTKVVRVSLFANMPHNNRWTLEAIHPGSSRNAMGANWTNEFIEGIYSDEARRQSGVSGEAQKPNPVDRKTAMGTRAGSDTPKAAADPKPRPAAGRRTAMGSRGGVAAGADESPAPTKAPATPVTTKKLVSEGREAQTTYVDTLPPAPAFLKTFGVENPQWWHYIALGILALLVIFMILRSIAKAKRNADQQKQFAKIVAGKKRRR